MPDHCVSSKLDEKVEHQVEGKIDGEKDEDTKDLIKDENDKAYPPMRVVLPAMAAIYLAVFLVALVRRIWSQQFMTMTDCSNRTVPSLAQSYPRYPTNSTASGISHGTRQAFSCRSACSNCPLAESSNTIRPNGCSLLLCPSLRSVRSSVHRLQHPML